MSVSTDPGHFFQSDASESIRARRAAKAGNKHGDPVQLGSKILDIVAKPSSPSHVYLAASAGVVYEVEIDARGLVRTYRGPTAPVTSLCVDGQGLYAGSWDKVIYGWGTGEVTPKRLFKRHSDFVKAVVCTKIGDKHCLISGGADRKIIVWDTGDGQVLFVMRAQSDTMMAVQSLAIDPIASTESQAVVVSGSSDPQIRRWQVSLTGAAQIAQESTAPRRGSESKQILEHETSVYRVLFPAFDDDEEEEEGGDLWTASADGTAKRLARSKDWQTEETYFHGDYVRAVAITEDWVVTAGRNEDIQVWKRSTGKLWHVFEGHFEEVTGLLILGAQVVSVSIDGTLRTWSISNQDLDQARKEREERQQGVHADEPAPAPAENILTADEEAELAELMDSDDD